MDFDLYIRKPGSSKTAVFWFKYIAIFRDEDCATLHRYNETAELTDTVSLSLNEEQQHSLKRGYKKASKTEAAKFLLLVKNNDIKNERR